MSDPSEARGTTVLFARHTHALQRRGAAHWILGIGAQHIEEMRLDQLLQLSLIGFEANLQTKRIEVCLYALDRNFHRRVGLHSLEKRSSKEERR